MLKVLQQIYEDIRKGKNIGLYLTIAIAIIVPILKLLKLADRFDILSLILAVLGFMLAKKLHKLWLLEEIKESYSKQEKTLEKMLKFQENPPIQILPKWSSSILLENLSRTQKKVVMVQSWFPDASTLADNILNACKNNNSKIHIELYLLDPDKSLGAQRWLEVNNKIGESDIDKFKPNYKVKFDSCINDFIIRFNLNPNSISYEIFSYPTLPTLKIFKIDNEDYYFGWLGLDGGSTNNVCFHVSKNKRDPETRLIINKIEKHLEALNKHKKSIMKSK